jgi:glycosyltransferase involved in cell wall biosynthesis
VRVLFVNSNKSPVYGGVERWMMDAAEGLGARGHACVMLGRPGAPWVDAARRRGIRVREDHRGPWAMRVLRIAAAMRAERPDVVVAKAKKMARMAAFGRDVAGSGKVALFFGLTHELRADRWIDRASWRRVDAGISVARASADWYATHGFGPPSKHYTLWKGVDLAPFDAGLVVRDATRSSLGLAEDDLAIGMVGRLAWQKGIDHLFESIRRLGDRLPRARFFVVGDGRERPAIEAAAADLGGRVRLLGHRDDVPALLAAFDVVVQPSRQEAMVQTTLEAMATGRPIVSTRTVGADEAIVDGVSGLLVPVGDPGAMAEAIETLAADGPRRAAMGRAARVKVEEAFTMRHMLDRCEAILGAIASS